MRGIDYRPSTGQLYGIARNGSFPATMLVIIDPVTGVATPVGNLLETILQSGIAFDPVADQLLVNGTAPRQWWRINPDATLAESSAGLPAYAPGDVNAAIDPNVQGLAFSNNRKGPVSSTVAYGIDCAAGALVTLDASGQASTVGSLGSGCSNPAGFAIRDAGFGAAWMVDFGRLYGVNLGTGAATLIGDVAPAVVQGNGLMALATSPAECVGRACGAAAVPEPSTWLMLSGALLAVHLVTGRRPVRGRR